ncbi:RE1 [Symbiodinium sp. KB8]|nr:RE1 [Symbiodinium sp. KB8]
MFRFYPKVVLKVKVHLRVILKGMFRVYPKVVLQEKVYLQHQVQLIVKEVYLRSSESLQAEYMLLRVILEGMFLYPKVVLFYLVLAKRRGMAQLQAVMLKQMSSAEKDKDGEQSPETVKPGTTTLPPLPAVKVETASVDIMDWLEMLTSPMSDLSDGSGLWWERVKSTATRSYVEWAQRLTGSATSILYRLMTLYQPAGEEEKMRLCEAGSAGSGEFSYKFGEVYFDGGYTSYNGDSAASTSAAIAYHKVILSEHLRRRRGGQRKEGGSSFYATIYFNGNGNFRNYYQVETIPASSQPGSSSGGAQHGSSSAGEAVPDIKEMLADVGKMLKQMTAANIKKATIIESGFEQKLEEVEATLKSSAVDSEDESLDGLLDSGASHAMRLAKGDEYAQGTSVKVTLAGEDVREMKQNVQGTVLIEGDGKNQIQPIVPLGPVIEELDCSLVWQKGSFQLRHPLKGLMKVKLVNNCPEIKAKDALALIKELENKHMINLSAQVENLKAKLDVLRKEETRSWDELLKEFIRTGSQSLMVRAVLTCPMTKGLPEDVQAMISEGFEKEKGAYYLKQLPLTRRKRKLLLASNRWVVVFNQNASSAQDEPFNVISKEGKVVLEVNPSASKLWNLRRRQGAYQMLLRAAAQGKISDLVGSPSHTTWTTSTTMDSETRPARTKLHPYGHDELPPLQLQRVNYETSEAAKQMLLWLLAMMSQRGNVGFMMEQPVARDDLCSNVQTGITLWDTELWKSFRSLSGMRMVSFSMGALGHKGKRPTTMATNYARLGQMEGLYDQVDGALPGSLLDNKEEDAWSEGFKDMVACAVCDCLEGKAVDEEELEALDVKLSKLTKEQKESWRKHLLNDHQPYRADCSVCINAQATGYQHRRRLHPSMFTVALDLAGPFRQKGRDMDHDDYKYLLVAAYRCPKEYMSAKAISDYNAEMYVPDDPEEPEDDPLAQDEGENSDGEEGCKESGGEEGDDPLLPEGLEEEVEKLTKPQEASTIYITRPLRRRTTPHVLQAVKEIIIQLKHTGLHVSGLHSDRAREFKAKSFKEWCADAGLHHTKTAGGDPSGNSTAELGIKWIKARMRSLLKASGSPPRDWPMAAAHASASLWGKAFPDSPSFHSPATTFGNVVWFRAKNYQGTKEKKQEAAGTRWKKGWYKGPSMDVHRGHLISREDGGLTIAKSVKFDVFDVKNEKELRDLLPPATAEGVQSEGHEDKKVIPRSELEEEIESQSRAILDQEEVTIEDILDIYYKLEKLGNTDRRMSKKSDVKSWFTGAFVHGGKAGPRSNVETFPCTSKLLVKFAKKYSDGKPFSAVGIARNSQLGLHRDVHNDQNTVNMVLPLTEFDQGGIWIQDDEVEEENCMKRITPNGKEVKGRVLELSKGTATSFDPRGWHEVQPWQGDRVVMLMYTPRTRKLSDDQVEKLKEIGLEFSRDVPTLEDDLEVFDDEEEDIKVKVKVAQIRDEVNPHIAFEEITDEDLLPGGDPHLIPLEEPQRNSAVGDIVSARLQKMIKKAEVQYTPEVESVLKDLAEGGQRLQVTHTVSPQEVRRNLDLWRPSALKEFKNLTETKNALKVVQRHLLPPGCRIVPCKGVYTVKPDKGDPGYRRKTRLVACGNHVPEEETTFDLYAAGLDAASLRSILAFSSGNKLWRWGVTDIRQAFVLAKWLGGPVALQPPAIAFDWGLAAPGDMWLVQQAIYGLRESPAMWSSYRDSQLMQARWKVEIEGIQVTMKLEQLVTDNQVWRIVREDGKEGTHGYLLVYIDDLLVNAPDNIMWSFFEWISKKWEVDELDVLDFGHPIKFLGTELHRVEGGVEMAQEGFVRELLRTYGHNGSRSKIQGPRETMILSDEEERALIDAEPVDNTGKEGVIKEAQRRVGELLWLMGRTRPDIQHAVSIMSSRILRCPELVNKVSRIMCHLLQKLCNFMEISPATAGDIVNGRVGVIGSCGRDDSWKGNERPPG